MTSPLVEFQDYLENILIPIRLSCTTESGWPVGLSLWYLYEDGKLYCATQRSAKVAGYLENNPRCAYEIASDLPPYCGVRGPARAHIDDQIGFEILERLLVRYVGGLDNSLAKGLLAKSDTEVALVLDPVRVFSWNFTPRMQDALPVHQEPKGCP